MSNKYDVAARVAMLEGRPCAIRRCCNRTFRLSRYCRGHLMKLRRHGHPEGETIHRKAYATERQAVAAILADHAEHQAVATGLAVVREFLAAALDKPKASDASKALYPLARQAVAPLAVLVEASALYLFARREPFKLPDDDRLTYAIGRAVIGLAEPTTFYVKHQRTRTRRVYPRASRRARRAVGEALRGTLSPLFANLEYSLEAMATQATRRRAEMLSPIMEQHQQ